MIYKKETGHAKTKTKVNINIFDNNVRAGVSVTFLPTNNIFSTHINEKITKVLSGMI